MSIQLEDFLRSHASKAGKPVAGRLQAALALLERLRSFPSLLLSDHLSQGGAGVVSHETYGRHVHERLNLQRLNKNHGRRSSNLPKWGQQLLDRIAVSGFATKSKEEREQIVSEAQAALAAPLRAIIEQDPLEARPRGRTVEAVIHDLLLQSEQKGKSGDVAQFLVGAKLSLRFNRDFEAASSNKSDRKSWGDKDAKLGDFEIESTVIEVAVGFPDDKHLEQVIDILENSETEVWLLTRSDRVASWKGAVEGTEEADTKRIVITSVEAFVGQNITELGEFSAKGKSKQLAALFEVYNTAWVDKVGTPGIRIELR